MPPKTHKNAAFTLLEIALAIAVIGFLAGAVLIGQSLVRVAELHAISTEYGKFNAATYAFYGKYKALPGDLQIATSYWGATGGAGCVNNSGTAATNPGACDGNGNNQIDGAPVDGQPGESQQFWRQLALAELIEGNYPGFSGTRTPVTWAGHDCAPGNQCPASKYPNGAWSVGYDDGSATLAGNYQRDFSNFYGYGADNPGSIPDATLLRPEDAQAIDQKLDDGRPASGSIFARDVKPDGTAGFGTAAACTTSTGPTDFAGIYNVLSGVPACALRFFNLF